ncbi:MAG: hypothetical protein COA79_10890 [Planctomycetota bacterium]|nr:MAG: hypothetical protein COA79_10890 [Planctomycetota bacterium]
MRSRHLILSFIFLFFTFELFACKTPVYKYALKKWGRDVYDIVKIYDSKKSNGRLNPKMEKAVLDMVKISSNGTSLTNVRLWPVDINGDIKKRFGDEVYKYYKNQLEYQKPPFYIIFNPKRKPIYCGEFSEKDIPNLMLSPAREKLINALATQKVVFMLIASSNAEKNEAAKKILDESIKEGIKEELIVRKRRVKDLNDEEKKFKPLEIIYVTIDPNDDKEEWFKRQLIGISDEIKDDDEPKVFGVVGKGYVFEKCLTKETLTNKDIIDHIIFLTGPCSCTVKKDNKGMDIITGWDWGKTVDLLPDVDDGEETKIAGFGGEEIEEESNKKNENGYLKIVLSLIIVIGVGVLLMNKLLKPKDK